MAAEDKLSKPPIKIRSTTGLWEVGQGVSGLGKTGEEIQVARLASVGDDAYTPESATERLLGLGYTKDMWSKVQDRLSHELRALIRIARGSAPRLLKDVIPEVDVEEKIGKDGCDIRYFQQVLGNRSRFDGWERQVGAEHEALIRGILFKDKTFIWTNEGGHKAVHLADNMGDKLPVVDVTVLARAPKPDQTILDFRVYPDAPDEDIDLIAGYFRRSMNDSPSVQLSIMRSGASPRQFKGTFSEYFQEEGKSTF